MVRKETTTVQVYIMDRHGIVGFLLGLKILPMSYLHLEQIHILCLCDWIELNFGEFDT